MLKFDAAGAFDPAATVEAAQAEGSLNNDYLRLLFAEIWQQGYSRGWEAAETYHNPKRDAETT